MSKVDSQEFKEVFLLLRSLLDNRVGPDLYIFTDSPEKFEVYLNRKFRNRDMYVAGVVIKKNYVSFYFMPIYVCPELLEEIPPELIKRKQGKSCFNFRSTAEVPVAKLKNLINIGIEKYMQVELPE